MNQSIRFRHAIVAISPHCRGWIAGAGLGQTLLNDHRKYSYERFVLVKSIIRDATRSTEMPQNGPLKACDNHVLHLGWRGPRISAHIDITMMATMIDQLLS
jgi:hypothetical protein